MISPDDTRHGTNAGYTAGCREPCCKQAHAAYRHSVEKDRILGKPRMIPAEPSQRRIQALMYLGHSYNDIAGYAGVTHTTLYRLHCAPLTRKVRRSTAEGIEFAYTNLARKLGNSKKAKQAALKKGWKWKNR